MPSTFPPGTVSKLGVNLLKENRVPHITYVAPNGTKFYLAGPLAPLPGAQNGLAALSLTGLTPPFKHLDNQGARQDGTTWIDTVYEPGEIDMVLEASGVTPADMRKVMRSWQGAWNPKEQGRLHVFTPENGEWWARVRQLKNFPDPITYSHEQSGRQRFTWSARNDDAFWESFDSVSSFGLSFKTNADSFNGTASSSLGSGWVQTYYSTSTGSRVKNAGAGTCGLSGNGTATWNRSGNGSREVVNRRNGSVSASDNQVVSVVLNAPINFDFLGGVFFDIWGRMDANGNGVRARIGGNGIFNSVTLSAFTGGTSSVNPTETQLWSQPILVPPGWNEKWTLICGTTSGSRNFKVQRGGFTIVDYTDSGTSALGSAYRGWGFGMAAAGSLAQGQVAPPDIIDWYAGDNANATQSGYVSLVNRGDIEAWPRYLCYGPGTFSFADGPNSKNTVTFGPLLEGQVALVTTLPRLRGVVDLSPSAPKQQQLNAFQSFIKALVDLATNNNVPPLLEQFESLFGIVPPQGALYSLLSGRFTTPIAAKSNDSPPSVSKIAVTITSGNANSKVVAAITPRRRWPM